MICWGIILSVLVLVSGQVNAETPVQKAFYESTQREMVYQELPCDCDCHRHVYDYRECAVCMHRGGKFAQRIIQKKEPNVELVDTVNEAE